MRRLEERSRRRRLQRVLAASAVGAFLLAFPASSLAGLFGANLLLNPGAEASAGATSFGCNALPCPDPPAFQPPAEWTIAGNFTAIAYATSGAPAPPPDGGLNFFAGGYRSATTNTAFQAVDVSSAAAQIDATTVEAELSGWLAGYSGESASPKVTANFHSGSSCTGTPLASTSITITAAERTFTFLSRTSAARLPVGTRLICVVMEPDGQITDYGDIYFDNLSLALREVAPLPTTPATPTTPSGPTIDIDDAIAVGAPIPSPAIPATTTVDYNPQTGQFFIRVKYRIRERALKRLCKRGCPATVEIRSRSGERLYRALGGGLPGDGALLGSKTGIRIKTTRKKLRIDIPITKARLLDLDFTTSGGFRVGETRVRVLLRTPLGPALTVRDGRIRVSIARIQSGALPGLQGILAL